MQIACWGQKKRLSLLLCLGFTQSFPKMLEEYFNPFMAAVPVISFDLAYVCLLLIYYPQIYEGE